MTSAEVPALVHCRSSPFSVPSMSRLVNARGFLLIRTLNSNPLLVSRLSLRPSRRSISSPSFAPVAMASSSQVTKPQGLFDYPNLTSKFLFESLVILLQFRFQTDAPSGVNGAPDAFQLIRAHQVRIPGIIISFLLQIRALIQLYLFFFVIDSSGCCCFALSCLDKLLQFSQTPPTERNQYVLQI